MVGGEGRDSGDQVWEAGEGLRCEFVWDTDSHVAGGQGDLCGDETGGRDQAWTVGGVKRCDESFLLCLLRARLF